jgi:hypothetical protein
MTVAESVRDIPADYRREYNRGWAASQRYNRSTRFMESPLNSPYRSDDWIDGFMDHSTGREKWHLFVCENHGVGPGTCGKE